MRCIKKIATVLGARPQFIKAATVSREIANNKGEIEEFIIHTGQHYDYKMSDLFFNELGIPKPYVNLGIGSGSHGAQTAEMLKLIELELIKLRPDLVLLYGDTNSTLAGALAASKMNLPIAHVEAGLRSFNKAMPEEINRIITDHVSDFLFVPTQAALTNLNNEGVSNEKIYNTGDVMLDAVMFYHNRADNYSSLLSDIGVKNDKFALVTIHRAENTNNHENLLSIIASLNKIAESKTVVFPVHPRTLKILKEVFTSPFSKNLILIDPVGYLDMIALQKYCTIVITDSGGVQKEAFINGKYCLTVRNETEWIELVDHGYNYLVNPLDTLIELVDKVWNKTFDNHNFQPYGDGKAAHRIVDILKERL